MVLLVATSTDSCTDCKVVFVSRSIGARDLSSHIEALTRLATERSCKLRLLIVLGRQVENGVPDTESYEAFTRRAELLSGGVEQLRREEESVLASDMLNMQFTSGMLNSAWSCAYMTNLDTRHNRKPQSSYAYP